MKRLNQPLLTGSILLIAFSAPMLQGPGSPALAAFGACPAARFAPQVVFPAGGSTEGIAAADFNGDGKLDLATTNFSAGGGAPNHVAILLGDGHGSFGAPTQFPVGRGATRVVTSDFNADGKTDVAVLNSNDGSVSVLLGDGQGGLGPQITTTVGGSPVGLAVGDFNGDGTSDLVVTDFLGGRIIVLLGSGVGTFFVPIPILAAQGPLFVAVGDLDNDGKLDIAATNIQDATVSVLLGNGDGSFRAQTTVPVPSGAQAESLAVADLDGDGALDLVVLDAVNDKAVVFRGHGDGSFGLPSAFGVGGLPIFVAVGDLNNDGHPDLAVGNTDDATVSVLLGRGDGTFDPQATFSVGSEPLPVALADVNGNGGLDIIAGNFADRTISVLSNVCSGNRPPVANAGPDQVLECTGASGATARLDGSGSTDPDSTPGAGDAIAGFEWSERGVVLSSDETASIPFSLGAHAVALKVTDATGATGSDTVSITVRDTAAPAIDSIVAAPAVLSSPDRRLVPVSITAVASDSCDAAPRCLIDSVTSNEPHSGLGGGSPGPDSVLVDAGPKASPAKLTVLLRSARFGAGTGRVYTIDVSCRDAAGNTSSGLTTVVSPHDHGKSVRPSRTRASSRR